MTESEKKIYRQVAQFLYQEGRNAAPDDEAINLIGRIADALIPLDGDYDEKYDFGAMHELSEWIGLKLDAPEMADAYIATTLKTYSDVFGKAS